MRAVDVLQCRQQPELYTIWTISGVLFGPARVDTAFLLSCVQLGANAEDYFLAGDLSIKYVCLFLLFLVCSVCFFDLTYVLLTLLPIRFSGCSV